MPKIYDEDGKLKDLPSEERLQKRQLFIKPLVEDYFAWVKKYSLISTSTSKGQNSRRTEIQSESGKYLKVFLD